MNRHVWKRLVALLVCLCLLASAALAQEDELAVTRSDFALSLSLHADAFPESNSVHYADWEHFLSKLSLEGVIDAQRFLQTYSRSYFSGGLCLNGEMALPFEYDDYYGFRYVRADALGGANIHFHMYNFFEFMLKGYFFMGLPTQLLAILMYPEASHRLGATYYAPIAEALGGDEARQVSYDDLYALCETLTLIAYDEDFYDHVYFYVTCLLTDLGVSDATVDKLCYVEGWLEYLDPEQGGMTISREGDEMVYEVGEYTLARRALDGTRLTLSLPDMDGYVLNVDYQNGSGVFRFSASVDLDGEERLAVALSVDGLDGGTDMAGTAAFSVGGTALEGGTEQAFSWRYTRDAQELPYAMTLAIDWLHPETGLAALTLNYRANMERVPETVLVERTYDDKNDFFSLNEWKLAEFQERFTPTLALSAVPFLLEMPAGVIDDLVAFAYDTGLLAFFGLE